VSPGLSRWLSISHVSAGFIAVLVGYTSSAAIVFQAAAAAGATPAEISSWLWALGIGMSATCIGLSLYFKSPVLTAWSTPGAALLITGLAGLSMSEAIGIFYSIPCLSLLRAFQAGLKSLCDMCRNLLLRPCLQAFCYVSVWMCLSCFRHKAF